MTIPRNRIFKNSKGFQAQANVGINSPSQTNTQSVNVILQQPMTHDKTFDTALNKSNYEERSIELDSKNNLNIDAKPLNDNCDALAKSETDVHSPERSDVQPDVQTNVQTRSVGGALAKSVETAKDNLAELQTIIKNKDNLIEALSLILDIYENNPLIVNKVILSKEDELTRLLFLLTGADSIELVKLEPEIGCCKVADKFIHINKILIHKGDNTYNFKYSYPNVVNLLDNRKISYKICI